MLSKRDLIFIKTLYREIPKTILSILFLLNDWKNKKPLDIPAMKSTEVNLLQVLQNNTPSSWAGSQGVNHTSSHPTCCEKNRRNKWWYTSETKDHPKPQPRPPQDWKVDRRFEINDKLGELIYFSKFFNFFKSLLYIWITWTPSYQKPNTWLKCCFYTFLLKYKILKRKG